jgi:predicted AAA+ superfamily ATPase
LLVKEVILFFTKTICEFVKAEPNEPALLEAITATHLARKYETFYWKNKNEVDSIIKLDKEQIGRKIKKVGRSWRKPGHLEKVFLLSKDDISLFLAGIEV